MTGSSTAGTRRTIVGLPGSGKSEFAKYSIRKAGVPTLVIDILHEYPIKEKNIFVFRPVDRVSPQAEIEEVFNKLLIEPYQTGIKKRIGYVVCDEANRYLPNRVPLPVNFSYINDFARHMNLQVDCVARRISQLHTDIAELSHELIVFNQSGTNDIQRLNDLKEGLGDVVTDLPPYWYVKVDRNRNWQKCPPITIS